MLIKKVAFNIPIYMKEILDMDKIYFNMEIGKILNKIIEFYCSKKIENINFKTNKIGRIQFNLNKKNSEIYFQILNENSFDNESDYMRSLVYEYINNPRYIREKIVCYEIIDTIEKAKKERRKLNIKYNGEIRTVNPYDIKYSKEESRLYLFCYCEKYNDYRSYIISKITLATISVEDINIKDKSFINQIINNFDPFISNSKYIKVRISEKGESILNKAIYNRPKMIKKENDLYTFECDEKLFKVYFSQFYSEIEIIEPENLRKWLKIEYEKLLDIYE